jgi:hypothetical protein
MSDRLDEAIRTMVVELVEAAPAPPPAASVLERTRLGRTARRRLHPVIVALLVLMVGTGGVLLGRYVFPSASPDGVGRIVAGEPAPEPEFSTADLGTEVPLLPSSGAVEPEVGPDAVGDVVAVGRVAGSDLEVFAWRIEAGGIEGGCTQVVGAGTRETTCSAGRSEPTLQVPYAFPYRAVSTVVTWRVPEGTSVAALEVEGLSLWQRPVGGVAAFVVDRAAFDVAFLGAWGAHGEDLGRIAFSGWRPAGLHSVFSEATGVALVFDDGLDGVIALDLDDLSLARRPLDGQRAGDPDHRLARVGDSLVVGWGSVHRLLIDTLEGNPIGQATVFIPAAEADAVWLIDYPGGRIGQGTPGYRLVGLDGHEIVSAPGIDPSLGFPAKAIPGGIVHETPSGITLWFPDAEPVRIPAPNPGFVVDVSGGVIAWCEDLCTLTLTEIDGGQTLVPSPDPARRFISARFSPDGRLLAAVVADPGPIDPDSGGAVALVDVASGEATLLTEPLLPRPSYLGWSPDGRHLFFSSYSYGLTETVVGWYRPADGHLEVVTLPFGGALSFVVLDRDEAGAFFPADQ